jgi:hypothetical protein
MVPWLVETIKARNEDQDAITTLLCRIIDPREYDGNRVEAEALVDTVNDLLAVDGFVVGLDRGRPFATAVSTDGERAANERVAAALASPELRMTVRSLVRNQDLADLLISRLDGSRRRGMREPMSSPSSAPDRSSRGFSTT